MRPATARRLCAAALVTALTLAAGACGNDDAASQPAPTTTEHDHATHDHGDGEGDGNENHAADLRPAQDPCSLVTQTDAAAVLGPVSGVAENHPLAIGVVSDQRVCSVSLERDPNLGANVGLADHEAAEKFQGMRTKFQNMATDIADLGDDAVWLEPFRVLLVLRGGELISVQLRDVAAPAADARAQAIGLGALALRHLDDAGSR